MPSYHWRETAVVLIDSMGYTLSFMRMPPQGIGTPHVSDEVAHFLRNGRTSRRTSPAELSPVISEPFLLPSQYSARLHELQSILPAPPEARQPDPEEAIRWTELGTLDGALIDGELMPQRDVFEAKGYARSEVRDNVSDQR